MTRAFARVDLSHGQHDLFADEVRAIGKECGVIIENTGVQDQFGSATMSVLRGHLSAAAKAIRDQPDLLAVGRFDLQKIEVKTKQPAEKNSYAQLPAAQYLANYESGGVLYIHKWLSDGEIIAWECKTNPKPYDLVIQPNCKIDWELLAKIQRAWPHIEDDRIPRFSTGGTSTPFFRFLRHQLREVGVDWKERIKSLGRVS